MGNHTPIYSLLELPQSLLKFSPSLMLGITGTLKLLYAMTSHIIVFNYSSLDVVNFLSQGFPIIHTRQANVPGTGTQDSNMRGLTPGCGVLWERANKDKPGLTSLPAPGLTWNKKQLVLPHHT